MLGSHFDLFLFYLSGCFAMCSMGLLVASFISSEELVNGLLDMLTFPMMFLSEIWFSLEGSPEWVQSIARFLPLWHMTDGMRKIMYEGVSLSELIQPFMVLLFIGLILTVIGAKNFRWLNVSGRMV